MVSCVQASLFVDSNFELESSSILRCEHSISLPMVVIELESVPLWF